MITIKSKSEFLDCRLVSVKGSRNSRYHAIRVRNILHDPLRPGNIKAKIWDLPTGVWRGVFVEKHVRSAGRVGVGGW